MFNMQRLLFVLLVVLYGCSKDTEYPREKQFPHAITLHPSNINTAGALLRGEIAGGAWEGKEDIDYGFIVSIQQQQSLLSQDTIIVGETSEALKFDHYITNLLVLDSEVYVYAFARDDDYLYLGNRERFIFSGEMFDITGFYPGSGVWQDTILVFGKRLTGYPDDTKVIFRQDRGTSRLEADIVALGADTIMAIVPAVRLAEESEIFVEIAGQSVLAKELFYHSPPIIEGFYPREGSEGDTITIYGTYLGHPSDYSLDHVSFASHMFESFTVLEWTPTRIIAVLDDLSFSTESPIRVRYNMRTGLSEDLFYYFNP